MRARLLLLLAGLALLLVLPACAGTADAGRIALLAPFEGTYAEIGYNALYAARLALSESTTDLRLLAVDDGGTPEQAHARYRALQQDSSIRAIMVMGPAASGAVLNDASDAGRNAPTIIIGLWSAVPPTLPDNIWMASSPETIEALAEADFDLYALAESSSPLLAPDLAGLRAFAALRDDLSGVTLLTDGSPPDGAFAGRFQASDLYVPVPNHLAGLVFDMTRFLASTDNLPGFMTTRSFPGIAGDIRFQDGFLADRSPSRFIFDASGQLTATDDAVE
ncbi:MAG: hypothetical protein KME04_02900 [Pleurocapsa minor GSE-CHR-MK-17-07R]|jgi:hypothetical protein|nr:hypothetical protein [Pleurocapsa minor GSE-CHR-MK 17-07R]